MGFSALYRCGVSFYNIYKLSQFHRSHLAKMKKKPTSANCSLKDKPVEWAYRSQRGKFYGFFSFFHFFPSRPARPGDNLQIIRKSESDHTSELLTRFTLRERLITVLAGLWVYRDRKWFNWESYELQLLVLWDHIIWLNCKFCHLNCACCIKEIGCFYLNIFNQLPWNRLKNH